MDARQTILDTLKHSTSQQPMSFDALLQKTGLMSETLQLVLDGMYNQVPALVNRALHIKSGKEQYIYWPTGVVQSFKGDQASALAHAKTWSISNKRPALPRRQEKQTASQAMAQKGEQMTEIKTVSMVDLVKYVASRPGVQNADLLKAFDAEAHGTKDRFVQQICNCLTRNYLKRREQDKGLVVGDNKPWLLLHGIINEDAEPGSVATPQTTRTGKPLVHLEKPEGVDAAGPGGEAENGPKAGNQPEEPPAKPSPELGEPIPYSTSDSIEVPAFLRKPESKTFSERLSLQTLLEGESKEQVETKAASKFRVAVASDRTLTIYGKTTDPIELDAEEAQALRDFMDGISMLFPAL